MVSSTGTACNFNENHNKDAWLCSVERQRGLSKSLTVAMLGVKTKLILTVDLESIK